MDTLSAEAIRGFEAYRLSPQQRAVWLAQQACSGNAFRTQCMLWLDGNLNTRALRRAFERIVARHQILRTGFRSLPGMAIPLQVIGEGGAAWKAIDLSDFDPQTQAAKLDALFEQERRRDADFEGSLLRLSLLTLSPDKHALLIGLPALCADSATLRNLASEIGPGYASALQDAGEFVDAVPYLQFSEWQNQLLETEDADREAGREFWSGSLSALTLPFEKKREEPRSFEPESFALALDAALEGRHDPAVFLLTAWQILLFRLTGEQDIRVNVHCDGRQYEELRDALGLFAKYLPVRCQLTEGLTFSDALRESERGLSDAREWQDYWEPRLEAAQDAIAFEYEEQAAPYRAGGVTFSLARQYCCSDRYKLKLAVTKAAGQTLHAALYYDPNAFDRDTVSHISDSFAALLQSAIRDPDCAISKLPILTAGERQRLLTDLNRTRTDQADLRCVHHWFEEQVARTPNDIALVCGEQRLTYAELNARANRLAHSLRRLGVKPDACVALCVERSAEALVGVLGILKAGGAYVPLNPEYPKARLAYLLSEIRAAVLLAQQSLLDALPEFAGKVICLDSDQMTDESESDPSPVATLEHLVYVLYTSGSTGTPKGVAVTHRSLSNYTEFICAKLELKHKRLAFATVSTLSADLGNTCIFPSLVSGGCLHVLSYEVATDAALFAEYVARYSIDVLKIVPSHLKTLLDSEAAILPREYLILGGEASSWKLIERIAERGNCHVINHYGPTETTVGSLTFDLDDERPQAVTVPIGRPIANTEVYVLDPHRNPVPIGVAGELYIGGVGLARGYLNRPELTAEKFVSSPFSEDASARLYKTGDLVRYLRGGHIEFLGRIDHQVKIRGFRIELGEIETALTKHSQLRENVVIARELESGDKQLIAYVVARGEPVPTAQELRGFLKDKLPEYMMPAVFVTLRALPLTRNGKLDRNALPDPDHVRSDKDHTFTAPRNPIEVELARIWAQVLGIERIGIHDNFFELGGDSILSIQIIARANKAGLGLSVRQLFEHQTIGELAQATRPMCTTQSDQNLVTGPVLFTPIQRWFFEQRLADPHYYNLSRLLEVRRPLTRDLLKQAIWALLTHHDALSLRFLEVESEWQQSIAEPDALIPLAWEDWAGLAEAEQGPAIEAFGTKLQASLNLSEGPLLRFGYLDLGERKPDRLLIAIHHLAVDGVSYRILLEDLQTVYAQLAEGKPIDLPPKTLPFKEWAQRLNAYAASQELQVERDFWLDVSTTEVAPLPVDFAEAGANTVSSVRIASGSLDEQETRILLQHVPGIYRTEINDVLLTALAQAIAAWTKTGSVLVDVEGHGREEIFEGIDVSRTVGWFTTRFPVHLNLEDSADAESALKSVKEQLRKVPNKGIGYGLLRYLSGDREFARKLETSPQPQLAFNYLGQFDQTFAASDLFGWASESFGASRSSRGIRRQQLAVVGLVVNKQLRLDWQYSENIHKRETVERLARDMMSALRTLIEQSTRSRDHARSHFPQTRSSRTAEEAAFRAAKSTPLDSRIQREYGSDSIPQLPRGGAAQKFPLSLAQQRLWFLQQFDRTSGLYNGAHGLRLRGALDVEALTQSLNEIVKRHESLRTAIVAIGEEVLQVVEPDAVLPFRIVDLSALPRAQREAQIMQRAIDDAKLAFDLARAPLMRAQLIRLGDDEHVLLLNIHHIIFDRTSRSVLHRELSELYRAHRLGKSVPLPQLSIQYADFAVWQRRHLDGGALDEQLAYWKRQLGGTLPALELPLDRPRPAIQDYDGARRLVTLPDSLTDALKSLSRRERVTPFTTLLAAFQLLLHRLSGQDDIIIGTPIDGRARIETEALIGFFLGTLAIRVDLSGNPSFAELLRRTRKTTLDAYDHQDVPFEKLVEELQPARSTARHPIFDVLINYTNRRQVALPQLDGLLVDAVPVQERESIFSMTLYVREENASLTLALTYQTALFSSERAACMLDQYQYLLEQICADPTRPLLAYSLVQPASRALLPDPKQPLDAPNYPMTVGLIAAWAGRAGAKTAITQGEKSLSYAELWNAATGLARALQRQGLQGGDVIAIAGQKSFGLVVCMTAVLLAGGVMLTVDANLPAERQRLLLHEARVKRLLYLGALQPEDDWMIASVALTLVDPGSGAMAGVEHAANGESELPKIAAVDPAYIFFTSGTTGVPKGILGCHKGLNHFLAWQRKTFAIGPDDRVAQLTALSFDVLLRDVFLPLTCGASLHLPDEAEVLAADYILPWLAREEISVLHTVPALAQSWLTDVPRDLSLPELRWVFFAGEPLQDALIKRWRNAFSFTGGIANLYGPTEATMAKCFHRVVDEEPFGIQAVGRPLPQTQALVLNSSGALCGIGEAGEIAIRTPFRTLGYINSPDEQRKRFVENPCRDDDNDMLYMTGDRGRYRPDGTLMVEGRIDDQIKINGVRVEPSEVGAILAQHPALQACFVLSCKREEGGNFLAAYAVLKKDQSANTSDLHAFLSTRAPAPLIPSAFIFLDQLPLLPNGKVDRKALPALDDSRPELEAAYVAPRTPTEKMLADIWAEVLKVDRVGIHDNFFDLGGHSLLATRVIARTRGAFNIELPLRALFEMPTVEALGFEIARNLAAKSRHGITQIPRRTPGDRAPLSFAQQRLWFLDQLEPMSAAYIISATLRFTGALNVSVLKACFFEIVRRHEALRTTFAIAGDEAVQMIHAPREFDLPVVDLSHLTFEAREAEALRLASGETNCPFDLARGPLFRASLLRLDVHLHVLIVSVHHIVSDGWSRGVLYGELATLYQAFNDGKPSPLAELPIQYADYAIWQRGWFEERELQQQLSYWKKQLNAAPTLSEFPTDYARPAAQRYQGARESLTLSQDLTDKLKRLSRREGVTLFMTLLAAFKSLLYRYSGQEDLLVGTHIAGRNRHELEGVIGFFIGTLALRTDLSGNPPFRQLLARVRETALNAYAHQDVPFERLVEELQPERSLSHTPLVQVVFNMLNLPDRAIELPGLTVEHLPLAKSGAKFDLTLHAREQNEGITLNAVYDIDLFAAATIKRLLRHLETLLQGIVADPNCRLSQLPVLTEAESNAASRSNNIRPTQAFIEFDAKAIEQSIPQRFREQVGKYPRRLAIKTQYHAWTYEQLNNTANRVAHALLRARGARAERIALLLDHDAPMIAALLGVLKTGNSYVPLDPAYPRERLTYMLADAQVEVLLTNSANLALAKSLNTLQLLNIDALDSPVSNVEVPVSPDAIAYTLYTSGSTGQPKGVTQNHRNVLHFIRAYSNNLHINADDKLTLFSAYTFDSSVQDIFAALLNGAALYPVDLKEDSLSNLAPWLIDNEVTLYHSTPSTYRYFVRALQGEAFPALRLIVLGGEAVYKSDVDAYKKHFSQDCLFVNGFGLTESTVNLQYFVDPQTEISRNAVPIGYPVDHTEILLLDEAGEPTELYGEIGILSAHVALGYWNKPELTRERFLPNPNAQTERIYRTGDMGRLLPDGALEFAGRKDHQVKLRGYRIELREIEAALTAHPVVRECVAALKENHADQRLIAYVVPNEGASFTRAEMAGFLKDKLPDYMIPSAYFALDQLPLTPSGKVNYRALPIPDYATSAAVAPRTPNEEMLAAIWAEVLKLDQVSIHDNFFDLGGHSLLATQVISRVRKTFEVEIQLRALFESPTVAGLSALIVQSQAEAFSEEELAQLLAEAQE